MRRYHLIRLTISGHFRFFPKHTATTEIYTLSLHDALPIWIEAHHAVPDRVDDWRERHRRRSEEHTSELQSHSDLVCRLLLEKKKSYQPHHFGKQGAHSHAAESDPRPAEQGRAEGRCRRRQA